MSTHSPTLCHHTVYKNWFLSSNSSCQSILMSKSSAEKIRATALRCILFGCLFAFCVGFILLLLSVYHGKYIRFFPFILLRATMTGKEASTAAAVANAAVTSTKLFRISFYRMTDIRNSIFEIVHDNVFSLSKVLADVAIVQPVPIDYVNLSRCRRWHRCQHIDVKYFFYRRKL